MGNETGETPIQETVLASWRDAMAAALKVDPETAANVMRICSVQRPDQLYAKYIAVGRTDGLFARAVGVTNSVWIEWMDNLRAALPPDTVKMLETPIPDKDLPPLGYRPASAESESDSDRDSDSNGSGDADADAEPGVDADPGADAAPDVHADSDGTTEQNADRGEGL